MIADHLRAALVLIRDGVYPSNEGRGYVLRRLIRRMYFNITKFVQDVAANECMINEVLAFFAEKQSISDVDEIAAVILKEVKQFVKTMANGEKKLAEILAKSDKKIAGDDAFLLYDTYGFPFELTEELAAKDGYAVDHDAFKKAMEAAQEKSRKGSAGKFSLDIDWSKYLTGLQQTEFV